MITAAKTTSMIGLHIAVAAVVGYVLTGSWAVGGIFALIEPSVNVVIIELYQKLWQRVPAATTPRGVFFRHSLHKGGMIAVHTAVAILVGYALTGDWSVGGLLALIEPTCNVVAYHAHQWLWGLRRPRVPAH